MAGVGAGFGSFSIDTLSIRNVRSYGDEAQRIKFGKPLTVIVGANGTGEYEICAATHFAATRPRPLTTTPHPPLQASPP